MTVSFYSKLYLLCYSLQILLCLNLPTITGNDRSALEVPRSNCRMEMSRLIETPHRMQTIWEKKPEQWKEDHWDFHTLVINTFYSAHDHLCSLAFKFLSLANITISLTLCKFISHFSIGVFQKQLTNKTLKVDVMKTLSTPNWSSHWFLDSMETTADILL